MAQYLYKPCETVLVSIHTFQNTEAVSHLIQRLVLSPLLHEKRYAQKRSCMQMNRHPIPYNCSYQLNDPIQSLQYLLGGMLNLLLLLYAKCLV